MLSSSSVSGDGHMDTSSHTAIPDSLIEKHNVSSAVPCFFLQAEPISLPQLHAWPQRASSPLMSCIMHVSCVKG